MALFYVYFFDVKRPGEPFPVEVAIYAESEEQARKFFKKSYGVEAKDLIRRENW